VYRPRILIADDEAGVRFFLRELLRKENYVVDDASDGEEALRKQRRQGFDIVVLDVKMPKMDGLEVLREMRKADPSLIAVMITAYGSQKIALEAIREGAYDYFTKPFDAEELAVVIRRALEKRRLQKTINDLQSELTRSLQIDLPLEAGRIIGGSEGMQDVFRLIHKITATDVTVLICGESGTGKELVAQAVHYNSPRRDKPFVKVSCVAIPETLLESELFGHERGAFTGAYQQKLGKFELAEGGTLFLDEIGDMSQNLQAKLLRVLQEREFERVGGTKTIKVDIRILVATNRDLLKAVQEKQFREDLYFRINVVPVFLPPLRERRPDIPLLVDHFISYYNEKLGKQIRRISDEVQAIFMGYLWPGNVREMENVIQRAMILSTSDIITKECLPINFQSLPRSNGGEDLTAQAGMTLGIQDEVLGGSADLSSLTGGEAGFRMTDHVQRVAEQMEKRLVREALRKCNFKRQEAAKLLGISRKSLHNKMRRYGLFEKGA
jgi:DNA-binding NtrC family response regulator